VRYVSEEKLELGKDTRLAFVDIEKAYESIKRHWIRKALHNANVSRSLTEGIKNI
jgi:hypothetical protein